ncbi:nucleotide sugar dehydrogenase [Candidatus Parcubacteria bacterium]|jgi:UDPglucose 6-dehydrogenase|nr:MAG: nucleotide sugar dehydrogenase [Candidatus Parcubacteria bacterium]
MKQVKIGVVGLWHLGCILCSAWSKLGNRVIGFDYDSSLINNLRQAIPPLFEPDLAESIRRSFDEKSLSFSDEIQSLSECDFIFLSYDTPVLDDDSSDTSILEKAVKDIAQVMKKQSVIIVSSQSPVGFCSLLRGNLKEIDDSFDLAYSPENLRLGEAMQCYLNPGRIILGTVDQDTETKCKNLFSQIPAEILSMNLESAEMVKHGINSFLSMSIVFANHLSDICEATGARIDDVVKGMKTDPRIGPKAYMSPGIGFSGGTLGRDLKVLDQKNEDFKGQAVLFGLIHTLNQERKNVIVNKLERIVGSLSGKSIGLLGLTYKPATSTLRRSLPLEIAELLILKNATVKVYDPKADFGELDKKPNFIIEPNIETLAKEADGLVLLTEWREFSQYDWERIPKTMRNAVFFDTKNYLNESIMCSAGFSYYAIGR